MGSTAFYTMNCLRLRACGEAGPTSCRARWCRGFSRAATSAAHRPSSLLDMSRTWVKPVSEPGLSGHCRDARKMVI